MFGSLGPMEMMLIMGLGVLLFGKRLPEVGRSLGRGIVEFKKGLNGVGDDFDSSSNGRSFANHGSSRYSDDRPAGESTSASTSASTYTDSSSVPRFELPGAPSGTPAESKSNA